MLNEEIKSFIFDLLNPNTEQVVYQNPYERYIAQKNEQP